MKYKKFFTLFFIGLYSLFFTSCSSSAVISNIENISDIEKIYESYWETDLTIATKDFKINQDTFSLTEESDGLTKAYISKEKNYVFYGHPAELLLNFYDESLKLIGYRIYFQNDQDLYSFICERMEEYDQRYENADSVSSSALRTTGDFEAFKKILDENIKANGIFTDGLNWYFNTSTFLKISVIKTNQNTDSAITISLHDANLEQNCLQLNMER